MGQRPKTGKPQIIYLSKKVQCYLNDMVISGLYGGSLQEVCERLVFRGIEDSIVRGIIRRRAGKEG